MFQLIILVQIVLSIDIYHDKVEYYTIHSQQLSTIFSIPNAQQINIVQLQNQSVCEAKQQTLETQILEYQSFDEQLLALIQFDPDTYLIFNANNQLIYKDKDGQKQHNFTIQLGYQITMIQLEFDVLLISNDQAYLIEIDSLSQQSIIYREIFNWTKREYRKMTKLIKMGKQEYLLSAVGLDGMELYRIQNRQIELIRQIQSYYNIVDFAEINNTLYILDSRKGLFLCKVDVQNLTTQIIQIDNASGGLAIDSYNGVNVFVAYKWARYSVVEYIVNTTTLDWYKHRQMYTSKIYDVDAFENYAIIQGQYQHLVLFNFHISNVKSYFKHFKLNDFQVFYHNGQTYFSGITPKSYVFSELNYSPAKVVCFTNYTNDVFNYNLTYTIRINKYYDEIHHFQFQVQIVDTYLYEESLLYVILIGILGILMIILIIISLLYRNRNLLDQMSVLEIAVQKKQIVQVNDQQRIVNSNLMSMRESKDVEYLNVKQV